MATFRLVFNQRTEHHNLGKSTHKTNHHNMSINCHFNITSRSIRRNCKVHTSSRFMLDIRAVERPLREMSVALRHSLTKPPPLSFISSLLRYHTSHFSSLFTFFLCQTPYISIFSFRFFVHLLLIFSLSLYLFKKFF